MAPKKKAERVQENVSLGPQVREGELVFGVARIFASKVNRTNSTPMLTSTPQASTTRKRLRSSPGTFPTLTIDTD